MALVGYEPTKPSDPATMHPYAYVRFWPEIMLQEQLLPEHE